MTKDISKQGVKKAIIDDVASMAGVSKTTVSRYLSGKYDMLAVETRKHIEHAIKELDYRPNQMAQGLKGNHSNLIGMVVADITNPFFTGILRGAEDVCKKNNYSIMVCNTDNDPAKEREYIFMLQSHRIDGLIITTTGHNNEFLYQLASDHTPVVLVDREVPELEFDTVVTDNAKGTLDGITFLLNQGYKNIGFFTEPMDWVSSRLERVNTFRDMLSKQNNLDVNGEVYEIDFNNKDQVQQKLDMYLNSSKGTSRAIFAANGVIMLKIILLLQQKGLKIPDDVAVAGFDNLDWAPAIGGGITTIAQPTYEIGSIAMERVLIRIEGEKSSPQKIQLLAKLIIRGSTPLKK
ncbi:MAG TPA: LacI family DNA-binding transcriptional regulator [Clostridium sp.]